MQIIVGETYKMVYRGKGSPGPEWEGWANQPVKVMGYSEGLYDVENQRGEQGLVADIELEPFSSS
jgi:hypothetical protein